MHRIDTDHATVDHKFTDADPGTVVDDDFMNALQEELCAVIEAAGIALVKGTNTQLLAAIEAIMGGGRVVDSALTENGGYRVYSDGLIECWGVVSCNSNSTTTVTLPYAHTAWCVPVSDGARASADEQNCGVRAIVGTPPTGFTIFNGNVETVTRRWHSRGK